MKREQLKRLIKLLLLSILKRIAAAQGGAQSQAAPEESFPRQEVSTTGGAPGFQTPKAFQDKKKVK